MIPYPKSTSIVEAGYSPDRQVFRARFPQGRMYDYLNVPPDVYQAFLEAESKGQFVNWEIKPNFDYEEID